MSQQKLIWERVRPLWPVRLASGQWAWLNVVMRKKRSDGTYIYAFVGEYWADNTDV